MNINEWSIRKLFYGYQHGDLTHDYPENEYLSPAMYDDEYLTNFELPPELMKKSENNFALSIDDLSIS